MEFLNENIWIGQLAICFILAAIPALLWGIYFLRKHKERKELVILTFIGGILAVGPLLLYKYLWQFFPWINAFQWTRSLNVDVFGLRFFEILPLSIIATFLFVGVIEEIAKIFAVRIIDNDKFKSVDDAIEFCIVAALGFAFIENIIYFQNILAVRGLEQLFMPFVFRSIFSTFAHVMFSGIFGYFYGVAHFASPILQQEMREGRHNIIKLLHKHLHFKKVTLFKDEKVLEGFLIASALHAMFNIFLEMGWVLIITPYLMVGFFILNSLLKKKKNMKEYGTLVARK